MVALKPKRDGARDGIPPDTPTSTDNEKLAGGAVDTPVPLVTLRTFLLGAFVSIGGLIFGYDTGQISGFLAMKNYQHRYGQPHGDGKYYFSNVRSGLIVGLVR